jgi:hypothetical protein
VRESEWREAQEWITMTLAQRGTPATGEIAVDRQRPWSTVARVPTAGAQVWFKRNNPATAYEAGLARALASLVPHQVVTPIAVDAARGWQLLPDAGRTLRSVAAGGFDAAHWEDLLVRYAHLQLSLAPHAGDLVALGVPDLRPELLPGLFAGLLDDPSVRSGLAEGAYDRLRAFEGEYAKLCELLAGSAVGVSVQHDDLHDGNVLVDDAGQWRFFDFGDASVAHPFGTLLVTLRVVRSQGGDEAVVARLRDAYLSCWDGDLAELREVADAAIRVSAVSRSLAWQRALVGADAAALGEFADAVPGWLEELLPQ